MSEKKPIFQNGRLAFSIIFIFYSRFPSNNAPVCSAMTRAGNGISFLNHHSTAPTTAEPNVTSMSGHEVSAALFCFGIATLIGSKFGGFLTDRIGNARTLVGGLVVHVIALVLLSTIAKSTVVVIPLLMLWSFSEWSSGPGIQFNLVWLAPEASGIMLSLYGSFIQLGIAVAAGMGGIAVRGTSVQAVSWVGAVSVTIAALIAALSFSLNSKAAQYKKVVNEELL